MKANPPTTFTDEQQLLDLIKVLFRLNELVLDGEFCIHHISTELCALLSPINSNIIDEHISGYLQQQDFEAMLDSSETKNDHFIVNITVSKGQVIKLYCQQMELINRHWIFVTKFELVTSQLTRQADAKEPKVFARLDFRLSDLRILEANQLAVELFNDEILEGKTLASLIDFSIEDLQSAITSAASYDVVTLQVSLISSAQPVILKIYQDSHCAKDNLSAYLIPSDAEQELIAQLKQSLQVSTSLFESREHAVLMMDPFGVINKVNSKMANLLGNHELFGKRAKAVLPPQIAQLVSTSEKSIHDVVIGQGSHSHRLQLKQQPLRSDDGVVLGLLITLSEHVDSTDTMKYRALYAASLAAEHAIFITDASGCMLFVNEVFEVQTGYSASDILDQDVSFLKNGALDEENYRFLWRSVQNKDTWRGVLRCRKRSGVSYWSDLVVNPLLDNDGNIECIVWLSQDITMDKELQKTGTYLANYDVATGLANAILAKDRLDGMIGRARRRKMLVAVIYLDVSEFEQIENRFGDHVATGLLTQYCDRLRNALRAEDSLARMSHGRIAVLLPDLPSVHALEVVSAKIDKVNQQKFSVDGVLSTIHFKQGVSYFPEQGASAESLFKNAEASLLNAWSNHNPIGCFGNSYNKKALVHFQLRRELMTMIESQQLEVVYQPVCEVKGDKVFSVEANLRWQHLKHGLVENDEIYTLAEASGCVQELGYMLIHQVCRDLVSWQEEGYDDFKVGINLSHGQLRDRQVAKKIAEIVHSYDLSLARFALEIPLSYIATQWLDLDKILEEFSLIGTSLQYDKFGERGAYISDLRSFPFDGIKLSKSYIEQIDSDPTAANLVQGIIAMAISLNLEVTAVGVEDLSQLLQLQEMNCHYGQGPFFTTFVTHNDLTKYFIQNVAQPRLN